MLKLPSRMPSYKNDEQNGFWINAYRSSANLNKPKLQNGRSSSKASPKINKPIIVTNNLPYVINNLNFAKSSRRIINHDFNCKSEYLSRVSSAESSSTNKFSRSSTNSSAFDCRCIFCVNKSKRKENENATTTTTGGSHALNSPLDSKTFFTTLNRLKTSVKLENLNDEIENLEKIEIFNNLNSPNLDKPSRVLLSKSSRIKLWKPNEINKFTNENMEKCRQIQVKRGPRKENDANSDMTFRNMLIKTELVKSKASLNSNLAKVFKDLKLNPNLSPLLYQDQNRHDNKIINSLENVSSPPSSRDSGASPRYLNSNGNKNNSDGSYDNLWSYTNSDILFEDSIKNPPSTPQPLLKVTFLKKSKTNL